MDSPKAFRVDKEDIPMVNSTIMVSDDEAPLVRRPRKGPKKRKVKPTVRTRRAKGEHTDPSLHFSIIEAYTKGTSAKDLAYKHQVSADHINRIITTHWENLTNLREARLLTVGIKAPPKGTLSKAYLALDKIQRANKGLNQDFLDELSETTNMTLTEPEIQFALIYVATGSGSTALKKAKLTQGIMNSKATSGSKLGTKLAIELRVDYLKNKPNVAEYINELRTEKYIPEAVDLQSIQRELLEQLAMCKADDSMTSLRQKGLLLKITETLGKTIGAFSDRIQVEHVDPAAALDYLSQLNTVEANVVHPLIELTPEST